MSSLSLRNSTPYIAMFVVLKGEQVLVRMPGIAPGAQLQVPTDTSFQITARAVIGGNTYSSAPIDEVGAGNFLAQVIQVRSQGTYEFNVVQTPSTEPDQLQFHKTCLSPVTFVISRDGVVMQNVVVTDSFEMKTLDIGGAFGVYAIINGITTETVLTANPAAVITAVADNSVFEQGYFSLQVT
jgi:hypothetical protein